MAEDYPDYSPPYLVRHGKFKRAAWSGPANAGGTRTLLTITGKGVIYGGNFIVEGIASCKTDIPYLVLDIIETSKTTFENRDKYNLTQLYSDVLNLIKYDDTNFVYVLQFCNGITFEKEVAIKYEEMLGRIPTLSAVLYYTLLK